MKKIIVQCSYCGEPTKIIEGQNERPLCEECKKIFNEKKEKE